MIKKINVGIDLGTTYSAVATFSKELGKVQVLENSFKSETTPSVVCLDGNSVLIGSDAKVEQKNGNANAVSFYKSMMGDPDWGAYIDGNKYSAEQLSGYFLKALKEDIEKSNEVEIGGAVITVPAYFNDKQREATLRAGKWAGLNVLKIINEPTSAIIAYGLTGGKDKNVLVYDLGGGTFDVTIAHISGSAVDVLVTNGNHQLGGKDWDAVILDEVIAAFEESDVMVENNVEDLNELLVKCEDAKKLLSAVPSTTISMMSDGVYKKVTVTREDFDEKTSSLLYQTVMLIETCFKEISASNGREFGWKDIDEVVLVGGSTRMPQVKEMILREYGRAPVTKDVNVDTIVASGAAMQAELCVSSTLTLTLSAPVPSGRAGNSATNREPVTLTIKNSDIQDITAHSLGMLAHGLDGKTYINSIIIPKNSKVGKVFNHEYTFSGKKLEVYVLQGESRDPYGNDLIGAYSISGVKSDYRGKITVNFLYNANGVVEVNACLEDGSKLSADREENNETLDEIITRLERERKEAEELARRNSRIEVMLMIDTSGSMDGEPIKEAVKAALGFVNEFDLSKTYISVVSFANRTSYLCRWANRKKDIESAICKLENWSRDGGGTGATPIASHYKDFMGDCPHVMVILTDGYWVEQDSEELAADKAKSKGVIIYGIGIADADEAFLSRISSGKGKKVDLSQLTKTFKEVASSIATEVASTTLR